MIAGLETPAQTQPAETITTPTEEAPAAEEPAAAEEAPALSGKVTVYMPSPAGLADKLAAAFTEKTGVEVEQFQGRRAKFSQDSKPNRQTLWLTSSFSPRGPMASA